MFLPATYEHGAFRPMVDFDVDYACFACAKRHTWHFYGLLDTGSPSTALPRSFLPPCVDWESLTKQPVGTPTLRGKRETRYLRGEVFLQGVRIAQELHVIDGDALPFPLLGLDDWGRQFTVTPFWYAVPPVFLLAPLVRMANGDGWQPPELPRLEPRRLQDVTLGDYGDTVMRIPAGQTRAVRMPALEAPVVPLLAAGDVTPPIETPPPSIEGPEAAPATPAMPPTRRERRQLARAASRGR